MNKKRLRIIDQERNLIKSWESCKCVYDFGFPLEYKVYEKELEPLECSLLKSFSILEVENNERFKRLEKFAKLCNSGSTCCSIEETVENQFHREILIFTPNEPCLDGSTSPKDLSKSKGVDIKTKIMLSRGLLDKILDRKKRVVFPANSFSSQLQKDVLALSFLQTMEKIGSCMRIPMVIPYNRVLDMVYLYQLDVIQDETMWSPYVESEFMRTLFSHGFITIAIKAKLMGVEKVILLPKMHDLRCCMKPQDIIVTKKVKRISRKLKITINTCFHEVIKGIFDIHGEDWMYPEMQLEFMKMHYLNGMYKANGPNGKIAHSHKRSSDLNNKKLQTDKGSNGTCETDRQCGRENDETLQKNQKTVVSVEVWHENKLVAGEIGFVNGSMYTSISGFHKMNNSGNFQLVSLAAILYFNGFKLWDLGMEIPYKIDMGAKTVPRREFIKQLNELKNTNVKFEIPEKYSENSNGEELISDFLKAVGGNKVGPSLPNKPFD
ncbi:arginyltransferase [Theileria orientalis]|uniref:Arginyltransferase n=1 Tax=Theileria orientalis TaxID=68886 RepID=A0A976M8K4_THEOR|nr:arginyltransferase [Theileria orientalis]